MSDQAILATLPRVSSKVAGEVLTFEECVAALEYMRVEQSELYRRVDKICVDTLTEAQPLGVCPHCVCMNIVAVAIALIQKQVGIDALERLAAL